MESREGISEDIRVMVRVLTLEGGFKVYGFRVATRAASSSYFA